jgi:hypothetical protein
VVFSGDTVVHGGHGDSATIDHEIIHDEARVARGDVVGHRLAKVCTRPAVLLDESRRQNATRNAGFHLNELLADNTFQDVTSCA